MRAAPPWTGMRRRRWLAACEPRQRVDTKGVQTAFGRQVKGKRKR
jgi:hypothetical protein